MFSPLNLLFLLLIVGGNTKERKSHIEIHIDRRNIENMQVVPLIVQDDMVITNLDAMIECEIYREFGYEVRCWEDKEEKAKLYSVLLFLRKRFEKLIGIEDEIAKYLIGRAEDKSDVKKGETYEKENEKPEKNRVQQDDREGKKKKDSSNKESDSLRQIGISEDRIRKESIRVRIFIGKVKKNFLVDIDDLKSIIKEKFLGHRISNRKKRDKKRKTERDDQENIVQREMEEVEEKITQEFINLLIPPDTEFYF